MMKYIGYAEIAAGLGLGLGPAIGSFVFKYLEYEYTMYFFGALNFVGLISCYFLIPSVLNNRITEEEINEIEDEKDEIIS